VLRARQSPPALPLCACALLAALAFGAANAQLHHKHPGGAPQMIFGKSFGSTRKLKNRFAAIYKIR
jgi:hypothetical protein